MLRSEVIQLSLHEIDHGFAPCVFPPFVPGGKDQIRYPTLSTQRVASAGPWANDRAKADESAGHMLAVLARRSALRSRQSEHRGPRRLA